MTQHESVAAQHSPGPWEAQGAVVFGPDEALICTMRYEESFEVARANAQLVAAVPDLLAACKQAVHLYETYGLVAGDYGCGAWVNATRAAIAKAEGR